MSWASRVPLLISNPWETSALRLDFAAGNYKNAAGYVRTNYVTQTADPTTWPSSRSVNSLTATRVGTGVEGGRAYADYQITGTATGNYLDIGIGSVSRTSAANGQTWTSSGYGKLVGGTATGLGANGAYYATIEETGTYVYHSQVNSLPLASDGTLSRRWATKTLSAGTTTSVRTTFLLDVTVGATLNMTWRLYSPQLEQTAYPTSDIVTGASPVSVTTYSSTNPADVGNMTFTRASTGYAEDASGNLVLFGSGVPRITNKGVLIEEGRTNTLKWSQDFSNAVWVLNGAGAPSKTANYAAAPDGTITANRIQSGTGFGGVYQGGVSGVSGTTYTYILYLKDNGGSTKTVNVGVSTGFFATGSGDRNFTFNTQTGAITSIDAVYTSTSAVSIAGGWWRVSGTFVATATIASNAAAMYGTNTGADFLAWGAQLEAGSFPTSYIPTTSASVTRPADVFYYSGLSALSALTVAAQVSANHTPVGNEFPVSLDDGTGNNRLQWFHGAASPNSMLPRVVTGGVAGNPDNIANGVLNLGSSAQAVAVASGRSMAAANGVLSASGGSPSGVPPYTYLRVGANEGGAAWNNYIQRLAIYPFAASDAQLQSLSSGNFLL